jgi:hypothetical protein
MALTDNISLFVGCLQSSEVEGVHGNIAQNCGQEVVHIKRDIIL